MKVLLVSSSGGHLAQLLGADGAPHLVELGEQRARLLPVVRSRGLYERDRPGDVRPGPITDAGREVEH